MSVQGLCPAGESQVPRSRLARAVRPPVAQCRGDLLVSSPSQWGWPPSSGQGWRMNLPGFTVCMCWDRRSALHSALHCGSEAATGGAGPGGCGCSSKGSLADTAGGWIWLVGCGLQTDASQRCSLQRPQSRAPTPGSSCPQKRTSHGCLRSCPVGPGPTSAQALAGPLPAKCHRFRVSLGSPRCQHLRPTADPTSYDFPSPCGYPGGRGHPVAVSVWGSEMLGRPHPHTPRVQGRLLSSREGGFVPTSYITLDGFSDSWGPPVLLGLSSTKPRSAGLTRFPLQGASRAADDAERERRDREERLRHSRNPAARGLPSTASGRLRGTQEVAPPTPLTPTSHTGE